MAGGRSRYSGSESCWPVERTGARNWRLSRECGIDVAPARLWPDEGLRAIVQEVEDAAVDTCGVRPRWHRWSRHGGGEQARSFRR
jgi:hypothetical protein